MGEAPLKGINFEWDKSNRKIFEIIFFCTFDTFPYCLLIYKRDFFSKCDICNVFGYHIQILSNQIYIKKSLS